MNDFNVSFTIQGISTADNHVVARGVALLGGLMQNNAVALAQQKISLEYSIEDRSFKHTLMVVGHGTGKYYQENCICIYGGENLENATDHNFSSIAEKAKIHLYRELNQSCSSWFHYTLKPYLIMPPESSNSPVLSHSSSPAPPEGVTYLDKEKTLYVLFTNGGTGTFDLYESETNKSKIQAQLMNGRLDGKYIQYYDYTKQHVECMGTYKNNLYDGELKWFTNSDCPICIRINSYCNGKREGISCDFYGNKNLRKLWLYQHDHLKKYITFYENGLIHNVYDMDGDKGTAIELTKEGQLQLICQVVQRNGCIIYEGKGTLFFGHFAELSGDFKDNYLLFDERKFSLLDCIKCIGRNRDTWVVQPFDDETLLPWKIYNLTSSKSEGTYSCDIDSKSHILVKVSQVQGKDEEIISEYGLGGYLIREVRQRKNANEKNTIDYFPLPGEGSAFSIKGMTVNPYVKGYIEGRRVRTLTFEKGNKTEVVKYPNYDKRPSATLY